LSTQLGNIRTGTNTGGTISSNVIKSLSNITLPAGVWLLIGQMSIQSNGAYTTGISNYCVTFANSATTIQDRFYTQDNLTSSIITTGFGNASGFFARNITEVVSLSTSTQIWFNCRFFCSNVLATLGTTFQATRLA
jgi:hypothetical protein